LAGGLIGAAARPAIVYAFWLGGTGGELSPLLLPVSAGIGLAVGLVAVLIASFVRGTLAGAAVGALSGAGLAYLAAALTFLPLFFGGLLGMEGLRAVGEEAAPLYGAAVALAGALSGGGGALAPGWLCGKGPAGSQGAGAASPP
jgi:hypothetical protein